MKAVTAAAAAAVASAPLGRRKAKAFMKTKGSSFVSAASALTAAAPASEEVCATAIAEAAVAAATATEAKAVALAAADQRHKGSDEKIVADDPLCYDEDEMRDEDVEIDDGNEGAKGAGGGVPPAKALMSAILGAHSRSCFDGIEALQRLAQVRALKVTRLAKKRPAPGNDTVCENTKRSGDLSAAETTVRELDTANANVISEGSNVMTSAATPAPLPGALTTRRRPIRRSTKDAAMPIGNQGITGGSTSSASFGSESIPERTELERLEMRESGSLGETFWDNGDGVFGWDAGTYRWHCRSVYYPLPLPPKVEKHVPNQGGSQAPASTASPTIAASAPGSPMQSNAPSASAMEGEDEHTSDATAILGSPPRAVRLGTSKLPKNRLPPRGLDTAAVYGATVPPVAENHAFVATMAATASAPAVVSENLSATSAVESSTVCSPDCPVATEPLRMGEDKVEISRTASEPFPTVPLGSASSPAMKPNGSRTNAGPGAVQETISAI